ncbi:hypothetical protein K503DRAFT_857829 [Rhizopogon vinicolor AM-OR11-026]|uniref:Uncharacterized protein n=1 Tax=Rhizopogon vinicolor AM-OR11-026 TaxID=1314800 RepID=A0A1B7MVQ0_9AGAM|nr:hypothetical protein K503DRAFT_857829 [Rhizopogon vinicolor AM-OR11-026]
MSENACTDTRGEQSQPFQFDPIKCLTVSSTPFADLILSHDDHSTNCCCFCICDIVAIVSNVIILSISYAFADAVSLMKNMSLPASHKGIVNTPIKPEQKCSGNHRPSFISIPTICPP